MVRTARPSVRPLAAARRVGSAVVGLLLLAACGVEAADRDALAPTTTAAATTTSNPVLPGLDVGDDETSGRDDRQDRSDRDDRTDRELPSERGGPVEVTDDEPVADDELEALTAEVRKDFRDACAAGDERACDLLYFVADGGDDSRFGSDCGGRAPGTRDYCTPGLELDEDGYADPLAPAILELGMQCRADEATACDLLFMVLPEDADLYELGVTCNDRFPFGATASCLTGR